MHLCLFKAKCKYERRRLVAMDFIKTLVIILAFFLGLALLVHICSKHKYSLKYSSKDRKIEIYPSQDKSHPSHR